MIKSILCKNVVNGMMVSTAVLLSSCASDPFARNVPSIIPDTPNVINDDSSEFKKLLETAIKNADKLVISEHSHRTDFFGTEIGMEGAPEYIYAKKTLTLGEKILFLEEVRGLENGVKSSQLDCLFEPHHTIDFYEDGHIMSSMEICYECNEIQWSLTDSGASLDVLDVISKTLKRVGMKTERAWENLAKQRYDEESKPQPNESRPTNSGPPLAKWVAGQEGKKVTNPFTGGIVDVEGIPANTKVRDPNDKNPTHIFRVPAL